MSGDEELRKSFMEIVDAASGKASRIHGRNWLETQKTKRKSAFRKKALTVRLNPASVKQFKALASGLGVTQETALAEALNLLFKRYNEPEIA